MNGRIKQLSIVFTVAFFFNLAWENAHSYFYTSYRGGVITEWILVRAALFDALVILVAAILYLWVRPFRRRLDITLCSLFVFAIGLELFALATSRWNYSSWMPTLPCIAVGITPVIQLAFLGYLSFRFSGFLKSDGAHYYIKQ